MWDNLSNNRWVTKKNIRDNSKVPRRRRLLNLIRERWRITLGDHEDHTEEQEFEMPSHYMKEVVAFVKTKGQSQPVKTKKMTKTKWVPNIATPAKSVDPK
jgi:hypothetical protein